MADQRTFTDQEIQGFLEKRQLNLLKHIRRTAREIMYMGSMKNIKKFSEFENAFKEKTNADFKYWYNLVAKHMHDWPLEIVFENASGAGLFLKFIVNRRGVEFLQIEEMIEPLEFSDQEVDDFLEKRQMAFLVQVRQTIEEVTSKDSKTKISMTSFEAAFQHRTSTKFAERYKVIEKHMKNWPVAQVFTDASEHPLYFELVNDGAAIRIAGATA